MTRFDRNRPSADRGTILLVLACLLVCWPVARASAQAVPPGCPASLGTADLIDHDFGASFCELCGDGLVRIEIENPIPNNENVDLTNLVITEDLRSSGLTYVANSTSFSGTNITVPGNFEPAISGANNRILRWDLSASGLQLDGQTGGPGARERLFLEFQVRRDASVSQEGLIAADRTIEATLDTTPSCAVPPAVYTTSTGLGTLPLEEPEPTIIKRGRNLDAAQGGYSDPVFGHEGDDLIWRIQVRNDGDAPLQDFRFDDSITGSNFELRYVCDDENDAVSAGSGGGVGGCVPVGPTTSLDDFDVAAAFGSGPGPYIAAPANGSGFFYLVGEVTASCDDETNTVDDVQWGCQSQPPVGGISATSGGSTASDSAVLRTDSVEANLDISVNLGGINTSQAMGATGTVTITIANNSGGTVVGDPVTGLRIRNLLPPEYVVDSTFAPTVSTNPAYGSYDGMVDQIDWINPHPNTFPVLITPGNPADPLSNTELELRLTSSTTQSHPTLPDHDHMIRNGDVVTVTIRTVLINPVRYDLTANLDVREEEPGSNPANTDPAETFSITNETEVWWDDFCVSSPPGNRVVQRTEDADPEDIDPDVTGSELIFILTETGDPLDLTVELNNNGGKDADDYSAYVSFGEAMQVQTVPNGCAATTNPPPHPAWTDPVTIPATASVYLCTPGPIGPGATRSLTFQVIKNPNPPFDDDLTFRVDVIGEIALSDGTLLWFPTPDPRTDGVPNTVNNYTVDALWSRVIGYNLFKDQVGNCTENNLPPPNPDTEIQIGEECTFNVRSGGWFGFETPGFTYIAVQNVAVTDGLPDGQGYLVSTDPALTSTTAIQGISFIPPPPVPLDEGPFGWMFNTVVPGERITEKDHWFEADVSTRLLNDPIDTSANPNLHAAQSSNIMTSTFDAVFFNDSTGMEEVYNLGPNTVGFPREVHRRVDLTVTEPNLIVTKLVCNETRYGIGPACTNFVPLADDGDAFDTYVFQITVENEASSGGVTRAPAYDVTVTSVTDPTDQLFVDPLTTDGLDNDGDFPLVDAGDGGGEGTITDNTIENGNPARIIASYTHSDELLRIDPGESVVLYYRVDPDDDVAPLQTLDGTATATYDSLEGASGNQTPPIGANGEAGGARQFTSAPGQATIQILPVEVSPKQVLRVSNTGLSVPANPQLVSIGEEVEFQLEALIPVAQLRNFVIRDELPVGLSCTDAPVINLNAPPYDAAGFMPGGTFTPTCTDTLVEWNFGDQTVTMSDRVDRRFEFEIDFVARVDNVATSRDGDAIRNGGMSTVTEVRYVNEAGTQVVLEIGEAALLVREPQLDLTLAYSVAEVDAGDIPRVTVTATNSGTATAYNPRFLVDLRAVELAYRGDIQGANPPVDDLVTIDPDAPIFSYPPGFAVAPTESISFSFLVEVADSVEPERLLATTAEADWTSLPSQATALNPSGLIGPDGSASGMRIGAIPNAGDTLNDYESTITETIPVAAVAAAKTDLDPMQAPEIGSHRSFEIEVQLPEGLTREVIVSDALDSGSVSYVLAHNATYDISYEFVGIQTINGLAPDESAFTAPPPIDGTSGTAVWTIGSVQTLSENDLAAMALSPVVRIRYAARINNDLATNVGSTLQNTATVYSLHGETGLQTSIAAATAVVTATESDVTATKILRNVTTGKQPTDPPAFGDTLEYVVTFVNGGNATAYDLNIADTIPPEVALTASFSPTAVLDGVPVVGFVPTPSGAPNGPLLWGRQNADDSLDLPAGSALLLTYRVDVNGPPADGSTISNSVYVDWTSLDVDPGSLFERTGVGCPTVTAPNDYCFGPAVSNGTVDPAPPASPLVKTNLQATANVGEVFRYEITIPAAPYTFPVYDVRIYDDLTASAADLRFLAVQKTAGSATFTPVNTGTPVDLVLEDPTNGIDIPAGEQITLEIEVVLEDTPTNATGLVFSNSATYVYNWLEGNASTQRTGAAGTSGDMTITNPDTVTLEKSGPVEMTLGAPAGFTLDVQNTGTGPAFDLQIFDRLPNSATAGACDTPPSNFTAQVFEADGTTAVSAPLVQGTDFSVAFRGDPDCDFTFAITSDTGVVGAGQRLIVGYESVLDDDSQEAATATNVAGATAWTSATASDPRTVDDRRSYARVVTDGTVGTLDHEDAYTTGVALPRYTFEKTVVNVTTGEDPALTASPGDTLRYRLRLVNERNAPLDNIVITDELDRLNTPAAFEPGSLQILSFPAGADASNSDPTGGTAGTGLVDVRGISLPAQNDFVEIEFEATLVPVLANGSSVADQAQATTNGVPFADSDDPVLNGAADPLVPGDEDPTAVTITSAPDFQTEKISTYVTGDPMVLLAGETLRYTITVKNVGSDHATDATLRDAVPVNTTYLAGSTTLNGMPVPDAAGGVSPLVGGLAIYAPEDPTPGAMRADASATTDNVATLTFDVIVDPNAIDGTVISNQAFVSAVAGGVADQPSDDPRTPVLDDPTQDVVGNAPLLFSAKDAALLVDGGTIGVVDPGDTLRYTITTYNNGAAAATQTTLRDTVPANTVYVADSVTLNGLPVGQPDGGVFPLVAGIDLASSDLTPPLPLAGAGQITAGQNAIVTFDLMVAAATPPGTVISNQAVVASAELPNLLTDGDGNPATGPEPTLVVVGDGQQLAITKDVTVVGGGAALAGGQVEYVVRVSNISTVPATGVVITDDLDSPVAGQLAYVAGSATLNGAAAGVTVVGPLITADYGGTYGDLAPGASVVLRFRATLDAGLAMGTDVTNTGVVSWNTTQMASASVTIAIGGMPGVGAVNGSIWHDDDFDRLQGGSETVLAGWVVDLFRNGQPIAQTTTDPSGDYRIAGIAPNDQNGDAYRLRFSAPDAGPNTAALGRSESAFTDGLQEITALVITAGSNLQALDLPLDPGGVVYDAVQRTPLAGVTLTLQNGAVDVAASCFDDPNQQGQQTGATGFYKFDLNFSDASCPSGADYSIAIVAPGSDYTSGASQVIPPSSDATNPFDVPACPGNAPDAIPATAQHCEVQTSEQPPPVSVLPRTPGTAYHLNLTLDATTPPGSSQLFNNHLPVDPVAGSSVSITKTTPKINVSRGDLVPYEITFNNQLAVPLVDLSLRDNYPAGFRYVEGSARVDGVPLEPTINGRELTWTDLGVGPSSSRTVVLLLAVGAGVKEGEFVNRAYAFQSVTNFRYTGTATATVRVVPDPAFDCTDVLGKVFDDRDRDGVQDEGERGLAGIRLMTVQGLAINTDRHGRFHITCAVVPNETRGSNFMLKLDDRSLPSGYRMSTRKTQVKRATRGKALRFQFGASVHRVVGLDLADAVFEPGTTEMRAQWKPRLGLLLDELAKSEAILRLSYVADVEDPGLVRERIERVESMIRELWRERGGEKLSVETEVYWRGGAPPAEPVRTPATSALETGLPHVGAGPPGIDPASGQSGERHLPIDADVTEWSVDPETLATSLSDRLEQREIVAESIEIVKLKDLVPPIRFASGVAEISDDYVAKLRAVLDDMQHLDNVRLHLLGHSDDQALSPGLSRVFGDNRGLSRERAGEVAEYLQRALQLPPESISFAWVGDAQPIAPNTTPQGRAANRRVEVEVWYDQPNERVAIEEVVIPEPIKRYKVCRTETVCKLRYREGHERRARIKNLIPPLDYDEEVTAVPADFVRQIREAFHNLRDKQNVTVKFIAHTDDVPLSGRAERIYGTHLAISKARARRVALEVKERLSLPTAAIASEGRGASRPVASNATPRGRALNRRIEVEFWHDDPLLELSDEFQVCPDPADAESVTRVYDPPWGQLEPLPIVDGEVRIPNDFAERIERAMQALSEDGKESVRVRFVGYTANQRLSRRMADVYGDDIGLSAARARRAMERIQSQLELTDGQVEHEGRGFVHSEDVVNGGFHQGETSHVIAQVVYDELAVMDDYEGIEITPITRELRPRDPLALNLMRITVDGVPIDDPGRSSADIQRCTDVALDETEIDFRFDDLESDRRLSVTASPSTVPADAGDVVHFRMYNNYPHYIEYAEVRLFDLDSSVRDEPLAVIPLDRRGLGAWQPDLAAATSPLRPLKFVLRAYGEQGLFDETAPQTLWLTPDGGTGGRRTVADDDEPAEPSSASDEVDDSSTSDRSLLAGYGESEPSVHNIPIGGTGAVRVGGSGVPEGHSVWLAGSELPVDEEGRFVGEVILPNGLHTVEVAVLDEDGNGELFLRDLELEQNDWFLMGLADLTLAQDLTDGPSDALQGRNSTDLDAFANGRLAFFANGKFGEDWRLTASADTREGPIEDIFTNFLDKSPDSLFRRLDPDYHYPTFGDDSTIEELAPTLGKFYVKLDKGDDHLLWGNFLVRYTANELALVERGLYGANAHFQSEATTGFGERRFVLDGFAADPGTVSSREEFRGTGGSLYFLKRQDLLIGSERLRIEVRDKASGLVSEVVTLQPELDYDIDYFQGRVLLSEPLTAIADDRLLVRNDGLSGDELVLVVQYEFTPGFDEVDTLNLGGQGHAWLTDFLKFGATASHNQESGADTSLYAADLTLRKSAGSWLKVQASRSEGLVQTSQLSNDGGFTFTETGVGLLENQDAYGYRADVSVAFSDWWESLRGQLSLYGQRLEAGYSAPGLNTLGETDQYGGVLRVPITDRVDVLAKGDRFVEERGLTTTAGEVNVGVQVTDAWQLQAGARHDERKDRSASVVATQEEGERTDAVLQVDYDPQGRWKSYAFAQATVRSTGDRDRNHRGGVGGAYRINERIALDGEVSHGDLGPAAELGTTYQYSEDTKFYLNYALDSERGYDGLHERRGALTTGSRSRLSDSTSVYVENQYQHASTTGLARSMGITYTPTERWNLNVNWEDGTTRDRRTNAETERRGGGLRVGYRFDALDLSSGFEYIFNETEQSDGSRSERTTWLFRNNARYQMHEDGRLLAKLNWAISDSSQGDVFDGGFREAVIGYAYRPIAHDRLNALVRYTYFYNVPSTDQVGQNGTPSQFLQESHVAAIDVSYDVFDVWTIGGKYAYRSSRVSLDREDPDFFSNDAHLYILRSDHRFLQNWETSIEGRLLDLTDLDERRAGALVTLYRYFGEHFKVGVGYNFTDFSEDLTDLSYDHHGVFFNVIGTF